MYLQDILVLPERRNYGIGRTLFEQVFAPFSIVHQKALLTDDGPYQWAFYEAIGFVEARVTRTGRSQQSQAGNAGARMLHTP